jgi:hypothetical protein
MSLSSGAKAELSTVYAAGFLPFLGSLIRDAAILSTAPVVVAEEFFKYFYLANLVAMIPGEFIWTKWNAVADARPRIPAAEITALAGGTGCAAAAVFASAGWTSWAWVLIPVLSVLLAYPIGIYNGLKLYLPSKVVSTAPNVLAALLVVSRGLPPSAAYAAALTLSLAGVGLILKWRHGLRISEKPAEFRTVFQSILLTSIPFAVFYFGNYSLLALAGRTSRFVLWGNRAANYAFTFLLLASPVFINKLKGRAVRVGFFARPLGFGAAFTVLLLGAVFLLRSSAPEAALVVLNFDLTFFSALAFYIVKIIVVRKISRPENPSRG